MHTFYYPGHIQHDPDLYRLETPQANHVVCETALRGTHIHDALKAANLGPITTPGNFSLDPINDVHDYGMLNLLQNAHERMSNEENSQVARPTTFAKNAISHKPRSVWGQLGYYAFDMLSPILEHTWDVVYWNAQVAISAAALVFAGGSSAAYALCRPPGHHAGPNFYGGHCYLNNTAVAAHWLVKQGQRVAVLDLDYFHGNGTQAVFYGRSDVLFCSIHADPFYAYPYFWGYADEYGAGTGEGYNFNYPLPGNANEKTYLATLETALERIRWYVPDMLLISFGANIVSDAPSGGFQMQSDSLLAIAQTLANLKLPTVIIQEGGGYRDTLGQDVVAFLSALQAGK